MFGNEKPWSRSIAKSNNVLEERRIATLMGIFCVLFSSEILMERKNLRRSYRQIADCHPLSCTDKNKSELDVNRVQTFYLVSLHRIM